MQISPNEFLRPIEKSIKPYERKFISVEGPNIIDSLFLDDIAIAYSDFYTSRMVLDANSNNTPLYFDGLEQELIFLLIRVRKDTEYDPNNVYDISKNITYHFSGFTGNTHSIGEFFIQTGSYNNKIPEIFLNNPNSFDVVLDVFGSILEKVVVTIYTGTTLYQNLYLESVISDQFISGSTTGSTSIQVISGDTIPYTGITNITKDVENLNITITNSQIYILNFLTEFDFYQAYSRIRWVMLNSDNRFLTQDYIYENNSGYTGVDEQSPIIYYYPNTTEMPTGSTLGFLTKNQILEHFISGVTDYWDGDLSITGATSVLNCVGSPISLTGISQEGIYEIVYKYYDNANNYTGATINNITCNAI